MLVRSWPNFPICLPTTPLGPNALGVPACYWLVNQKGRGKSENNPLLGVWEVVLWVDRWKKSIIYVGFSIALFVRPHRLWLSSVAGVMLVGLAGLYLILTCGALFQSSKDSLLDNREESYDRFDDVQEVMDDIIPGAATSTHDSLSDQDAIMEI
uniref:Uncharacterized protein n=1 Tax=Timema douglasi TaxID=61478 RepID=A0A7R8VV04_TIMDO|nr:unnamed protein product [Timema douglasi]